MTFNSVYQPKHSPIEETIKLENVVVRYKAPDEKISAFKEYALRWVQGKIRHNYFLALQDVSLSILRGEVFGLIGHNGAGKSTLLKLIARVLRPTGGRVWVRGRVAPLLELGAGFHPELTGRENVFLNGSILGFTKVEMEEKFTRIVDFAELWDFIDAPMRSYSSGMWARLGFAVATDTQPEILIVDEILAVGDEAFQRKSSERIHEFREKGTTILMVSHSMQAIESLCHRVAWLDHGKVKAVGLTPDVVNLYRKHNANLAEIDMEQQVHQQVAPEHQWGTKEIEISRVRILDYRRQERAVFQTGDSLIVEMDYIAHKPIMSPVFGLAIHRQDGIHLSGPNTKFSGLELGEVSGQGTIRYIIPSMPLLEGLFKVTIAVVNSKNDMLDYHDRLYSFRILNSGPDLVERYGLMVLGGQWEHNPNTPEDDLR
jgi:lipopolysaccharide transport system ATP-binding protein